MASDTRDEDGVQPAPRGATHPLPLGAVVRFDPAAGPVELEAQAGAVIALLRCVRGGPSGGVHALFPSSAIAPSSAARTPGLYVDTGLDALLRLLEAGAPAQRRWRLVLVGSSRLAAGSPTHQFARAALAAAVEWARRLVVPIAELHPPTRLARPFRLDPRALSGGDPA